MINVIATTAGNGQKSLLTQALACLSRNDTAQADKLLSRALAASPDDADALQLMGILRRAQGHAAEAETYYRKSLAVDPSQPQVHHNLGNLLNALLRPDEAAAEQREAIRLKPNYAEAHLNLAFALSAKGDFAGAEKSCRDALRLQPNYLFAKQTLASVLNDLDRPREAEQLLRQTLSLGISNIRQAAALEHNLAIALKRQERFDEALLLFDAAQAKVPDLPAADYNRGNTLQQLGRLEEALSSYRKALAADPNHRDALACAALVAAQLNDFAGAKSYGERAIALDEVSSLALIALAIVDIAEDRFAAAHQRVQRVLGDPRLQHDRHASFALGFVADAFDRRDKVAEAFAIHGASNRRRREINAAAFESERAIDEVQRLIGEFEKSEKWTSPPPTGPVKNAAADHLFLLGFMRSGTTLLHTVLATNPRVTGIDEIEFLTEAARAFLLNEAGLNRLKTLGEPNISAWQDAYWNAVRRSGLTTAGKLFVDKMPFNSIRLPLISRLFPAAKILLALRDPRDVVLSCYRRRFNMGPHSFEFLQLDDCARFYAAVMTLVERYREKLPLNIREHCYEDMVADFDGSIGAVCRFAGIEWSDAMRDFRMAANAIDLRSASARQVRRGLYDGAVGQWRRYRTELAPVLPILAPWVERFGYDRE